MSIIPKIHARRKARLRAVHKGEDMCHANRDLKLSEWTRFRRLAVIEMAAQLIGYGPAPLSLARGTARHRQNYKESFPQAALYPRSS
jgi:hypothetical protein